MGFTLPPLPYDEAALEPHMSAETLKYHYGKHHMGYVGALNKLIDGTEWMALSLAEIVLKARGDARQTKIFNNAAQSWNHTFFWDSMAPKGGGRPAGALGRLIERDFGSFTNFRQTFLSAGVAQFGAGGVWLVDDGGKLDVVTTSNAETPLGTGKRPLLGCDLWEHAYYIDHRNNRKAMIEAFLDHLASWPTAAQRFDLQGEGSSSGAAEFRAAQEQFATTQPVEVHARAAAQALDRPEGRELQRAVKTSVRGRRAGLSATR